MTWQDTRFVFAFTLVEVSDNAEPPLYLASVSARTQLVL